MPNKSEKQRRKELCDAMRKISHDDFEKSLPMEKEKFIELFVF
jgi:hypothetical protein